MDREQTVRRVVFTTVGAALLFSLGLSLWQGRNGNEFYFLSKQFLEDIPKRFTGPGRFRFLIQPATAIFLGIRAGLLDARSGQPSFLFALLFQGDRRKALIRESYSQLSVLLAMSVLADLISQYLILRQMHPIPALLLGPVFIAIPYTLSRAGAHWVCRRKQPLPPP